MSTSPTVDHWESVLSKNGNLTFTFDFDGFAPAGDLISAVANLATGHLMLAWADGTRLRLAGGGYPKMAGWIRQAPRVEARWVADDLLRGAELRR